MLKSYLCCNLHWARFQDFDSKGRLDAVVFWMKIIRKFSLFVQSGSSVQDDPNLGLNRVFTALIFQHVNAPYSCCGICERFATWKMFFRCIWSFESRSEILREMANSEKDAFVNELYQNLTGKNSSEIAVDSRAFRPSSDIGIDLSEGGKVFNQFYSCVVRFICKISNRINIASGKKRCLD